VSHTVCVFFVLDAYNDGSENDVPVSEQDKCNMNDSFDRYVVHCVTVYCVLHLLIHCDCRLL